MGVLYRSSPKLTGPLLVTVIDFNPVMYKQLHPLQIVAGNCLSFPNFNGQPFKFEHEHVMLHIA